MKSFIQLHTYLKSENSRPNIFLSQIFWLYLTHFSINIYLETKKLIMDKLAVVIGAVFVGLIVIALAAVLGGTIVWLIWPHVIPVVLPGLVASGAIAGKLLWWKAVLLTWLCGILFKGSSSSSKSD
jgi:hypothetical protein